jgi:hypothetical protein
LIDLYIGEEPQSYNEATDTWYDTNFYLDFFVDFDIEITEQNVKDLRPLVLMYAGYRKENNTNADIPLFRNYIRNNIFNKDGDTNSPVKGSTQRLSYFLTLVVNNVFTNAKLQKSSEKINITSGYNDSALKLELYSHFKAFNDKWTGGNSIGQRNLIDEFLFLDKANRDIGQQYYLNLNRIISLEEEGNAKQTLYGVISLLIQNTGFDMKALPAYVNYYGNSVSPTPKLTPSKTVAANLFGTFTEVDYQESSPKIIIQYVQNLSKRLDMPNKKYKFSDDSFDISNVNKNPWDVIPITQTMNTQKVILQSDPNSASGKTMIDVQKNINQINENTKYDNIQNVEIKPLGGGNRKRKQKMTQNITSKNNSKTYVVEYKNKKKEIQVHTNVNEIDGLEMFLKKNRFQKDILVKIWEKGKANQKELYHIKNTLRNRIQKLY